MSKLCTNREVLEHTKWKGDKRQIYAKHLLYASPWGRRLKHTKTLNPYTFKLVQANLLIPLISLSLRFSIHGAGFCGKL